MPEATRPASADKSEGSREVLGGGRSQMNERHEAGAACLRRSSLRRAYVM